ncbi:hypothetical protein HK405_001102, partial [Cladochytrium tenue]
MSTTSATLKPDTLVGSDQYNLLDDLEQRLRKFQPAIPADRQEVFDILITMGFRTLRGREKAAAEREKAAAERDKAAADKVASVEKVLRDTNIRLLYVEGKLTGRYIMERFEEAKEIDVKKNTREEAWKEFLDKIHGTELHKTIIKCVDAVAVGESVELDELTSDLNLRAARLATRAYAALSARIRLHDD